MYLKSLAIQGFKSFADKTNICFEKNITAVVGPNGSGKSNISDAIRWVLGEQSSRTLRGSKMEDVIFAGTEKRPPVGFAEVSLTLDNSDGKIGIDSTDITATRRYYRSGESEFFINRQPVRLKDIHELFMDTGLGRDGYSVIGQGKIDEILAVKSDDRRDFFEEAAGISKFRYRKEEAETKLRSAEENLVRIRDITNELQARIEPLREQSEKAKKFLTLRDELRKLEVSCWLDDLEKNAKSKIKITSDLSNAQSQAEKIKSDIAEEYQKAENLSQEIYQKDIATESCRNQLLQSESAIATLENDISICNAKIASNQENIARASLELEQNKLQFDSISNQIYSKKSNISALSSKLEENQNQLSEISAQAANLLSQTTQSEEQANKLNADERIHAQNVANISAELSSITSLSDEITLRLSNIQNELSQKEQEFSSVNDKQNLLTAKIDNSNKEISTITNVIKDLELKSKSRKDEFDKVLSTKQELEINLKTISARIEMLQEMEKQYDGFSYAIKQIMKQSDCGNLQNIHGTIAKLLQVPEIYITAIETALGGAVGNIVTSTEHDAKSAINYLKANNLGRATFLPIASIKPSKFSENSALSEPGIRGIASSLCQFDLQYSNIIESLLGRIVIAENIDIAIAIAKKYCQRFKIVTLDGQAINSGGSMTGGSSDKKSGVFSRANELKQKVSEKCSLEEQLHNISKKHDILSDELALLNHDITISKDELNSVQLQLRKIEDEYKECALLATMANKSIINLQQEASLLSSRIQELTQKRDAMSQKLAEENSITQKIREQEKLLFSNKSNISSQYNSLLEAIDNLKQKAALISAEKAAAESSVRELEISISSISESCKQRQDLINQYIQKNAELNMQITSQAIKKEQQQTISSEIKKRIKEISEEKLQTESLRTSKDKHCKSLNEDMLNLEREILRLSSKISQFEDEEKRISDKLWDNYELTLTTAQEIRSEQPCPEATKKIVILKNDIKSLGSVNIDSIEEYSQVYERYTFLNAQKEDLDKAKRELTKVISDIVENMKTIFLEQFQMINNNFDQTFKEIFGGGGASLELTDATDVLNCGIEINVKIPGKSLKTISLLSGGEKAFVAIALYFAILKVRPAPFCVLDEIEAALDDVNVDRYASYLHKLCGLTQFIVITHRRGTMEKSEMLYGVTMQERGVSKLLALNISDAEKRLGIDLN